MEVEPSFPTQFMREILFLINDNILENIVNEKCSLCCVPEMCALPINSHKMAGSVRRIIIGNAEKG